MATKFFIHSQYGELLDLAIDLQRKHDVLLYIPSKEYKKIGDGIVKKADNWFKYLNKDYTFIFDGCSNGELQDWLRARGEAVFGGSKKGDELENNRQLNQAWFNEVGFYQPLSKNFKDFESAIQFCKQNNKRIMKQNGDAPKSINHMAKFDDNADLILHLEELKKKWNESQFGKVDFDLMEVVEGVEVAASVFFNGTNYLKNKYGQITGFLNFEEKKESDNGKGETTGEMGTTFIGVTENNTLFNSILNRPQIISKLRGSGFRGVFDINCIKTDKGIVALEPTMRPGIPATSYEFIHGLKNTAEVINSVARGKDVPAQIQEGIGMVMCVVAKPYPIDNMVDTLYAIPEEVTSINKVLWNKKTKKPFKDLPENVHPFNFYKDTYYKVATKNGYLLTVTGNGKDIKTVRDSLISFIDENLELDGIKYRTDIGKRIEEHVKSLYNESKEAKTIDVSETKKSPLRRSILKHSEPLFINP